MVNICCDHILTSVNDQVGGRHGRGGADLGGGQADMGALGVDEI